MARPKTEPSTYTLSVRGKIQDLANALRFYNENDYHPRTKGELTSAMLTDFGSITKAQVKEPVETVEEAVHVLEAAGMANFHKDGKGEREFIRQLALDKEFTVETTDDDLLADARARLSNISEVNDGLAELKDS